MTPPRKPPPAAKTPSAPQSPRVEVPASGLAEGPLADSALIEAFLGGEQQAFEHLYTRHVKAVSRLVYSVVRHQAPMEDIVQEVFLIVYRQLARFEGRAAFKTWLYRIAFNEALRHQKRNRRWVAMPEGGPEQLPAEVTLVSSHTGDTPEKTLLSGEQTVNIQGAMQLLSPQHQAILNLFYLEELSTIDIAQILDIPEGSVKSRLFYARKQLKQLLEPLMQT